jgi:hypothetical protein
MSRTTPRPLESSTRALGTRAAVVLALSLLAALILPAGAAHAAAYRYWGYYQLSGTTWEFATTGPDQTTPADGGVEGWRFAVGTEEVTRFPRATPTFDEVCAETDAEAGKKRVAVVIDYGRAADTADNTEPPAAQGRCAVVATEATGLEVLSAVADVRTGNGLVCGIDEFPASGCGDEVKTVSAEAEAADTPVTLALPETDEAAADPDDEDSSTGTYIAIGVLLLAGLAVGYAVSRRRSAA